MARRCILLFLIVVNFGLTSGKMGDALNGLSHLPDMVGEIARAIEG